jgi:hypothetical protein
LRACNKCFEAKESLFGGGKSLPALNESLCQAKKEEPSDKKIESEAADSDDEEENDDDEENADVNFEVRPEKLANNVTANSPDEQVHKPSSRRSSQSIPFKGTP